MGGSNSCIKLLKNNDNGINETDLKFLLNNTHFNEKEIKDWYQSFIVRLKRVLT
jgi:hypothetical protein